MRLLLLLLVLGGKTIAQPMTGTWSGKFSREGKSVIMQLELLEDQRETIGMLLLFSNDSSALLSKYIVRLVDAASQKFLLRRVNTDFEKTPAENYPKQILFTNRNPSRYGPSPNDPSLSKSPVPQEVISFSQERTLNFAQLIGTVSDSTSTVFSGNWYVEEVGINSFSRPAGQFYLKRENSQLTGATEIFLKSFIR